VRRAVPRTSIFFFKSEMVFRASYTVAEKLQVIKYFKTHTSKETAALFGINKSMVTRWTREADDLAKKPNKSIRHGSGRRAAYPDIEQQIYQESLEKRRQGHRARVTVGLSCLADGRLLDPIVIEQ